MHFRLLFLSFWVFCTNAVSAQKLHVLSEIFPPYQTLSSFNKPTGYAVDLVNAVLQEAELESDIRILPWVRAYSRALNEKDVVLFSTIKSEERADSFHWIGEIDTLKYALYKLETRSDITIDNLEQAKSYRIGVVKASHGDSELQNFRFPKVVRNSNLSKLLTMFNAKRFDLLLAPKLPLDPNNKMSHKVIAYDFKDIDQPLYIALSKSSDEILANKLRDAYQAVVSKGIKEQLMNQWLNK